MKRIAHLILCGVIASIVTTSGCRTTPPVHSFVPNGTLQEELSSGDYVARTYREQTGDGSFEILWKGVRVHAAHGYCFRIAKGCGEDKTNSLTSIGSDITGDGKPNLVVFEWTGGAHCCYLFHVFEIGKRFRYIQTINAENSDLADFKNVDDDPALEFPTVDWTFAYWKTGFASSPAPAVILKYNGQRYEMACDLMRKAGLPNDELGRMATQIRENPAWKQGYPPEELWGKMLDLIYAGNMDQSWTLAELSWPAGIKGKEQFLKDFRSKLTESPFWEDIQKLNEKKK